MNLLQLLLESVGAIKSNKLRVFLSSAIKIPKNTLLREYKKSSPLIKAILRSTCIRLTNLDNSIHTSLKSEDD